MRPCDVCNTTPRSRDMLCDVVMARCEGVRTKASAVQSEPFLPRRKEDSPDKARAPGRWPALLPRPYLRCPTKTFLSCEGHTAMSSSSSSSPTQSRPTPSYTTSLLSGAFAGFAVDVSLFPLDTLKTRAQSAQGFVKAGGFKGVYSGLSSVVAGSAPGGESSTRSRVQEEERSWEALVLLDWNWDVTCSSVRECHCPSSRPSFPQRPSSSPHTSPSSRSCPRPLLQ